MMALAELQSRGYSTSKGFYRNSGSLLYFVSGLPAGDGSVDAVYAATGLPVIGDPWPSSMGNLGRAFCIQVAIIARPSPTKAWVEAKYSTLNTQWSGPPNSVVEEFEFVEPEPMRVPAIFRIDQSSGSPVIDYGPKNSWPFLPGGRARFRRVVYAKVPNEVTANDLVSVALNVGKLLITGGIVYRFIGGKMTRSQQGTTQMRYVFETQAKVQAIEPGDLIPIGAMSVPALNPFQTYRMPTSNSPSIGVASVTNDEFVGPMPGLNV